MQSISLNKIISNPRTCWPIHIVERGESTGFRIGGRPPVGIVPKRPSEQTHYFGTFPISNHRDLELSIFTSFDYVDVTSAHFVTKHIHKVIDGDSEVIECVFHEPSPRGDSPLYSSEFGAYGIKISPELLEDSEEKKHGVPHKIGGLPFLYPKFKGISEGLLKEGYIHLLQWAFPGNGDCPVQGAWPFHDYLFHLYLRTAGGGYECKALLV